MEWSGVDKEWSGVEWRAVGNEWSGVEWIRVRSWAISGGRSMSRSGVEVGVEMELKIN